MSDELVVEIPFTDLQMLRAAVNSAFHHCTVLDLAEQYRKLTARPQSSNLTKSLQSALGILDSYIQMANQEDDESPGE